MHFNGFHQVPELNVNRSDRGHRLWPAGRQGDRRRPDRRGSTLFHFQQIHRAPGCPAGVGGLAAGAPDRPQVALGLHAMQTGTLGQEAPAIRAQRDRPAPRPAEAVGAHRIEREQPQTAAGHQQTLAFGQKVRCPANYRMLRHDRLQALGRQRKRQRAACVAGKAPGTAMQAQTAPLQQLARRHVGGRRQPQPRLRRPCL